MTDCNAAIFDVANDFHGVICGCHEILRRQGLLEGIWCLDPNETLGPGQKQEIDRVCAAYPHLTDDAFVRANSRAGWREARRGLALSWRHPLSRSKSVGANRESLQRYSLAVVSHLLLVAAWYLFVELGKVPKFVMPSPYATLNALLVPNYRWLENIAVTATEIFGGYILAVVIGIGIALLFSWFRRLEMVGHAAAGQPQHDPEGRARAADHRLVQLRHRPEHDDGVRDLLLPDRADHRARADARSSPICSIWCAR